MRFTRNGYLGLLTLAFGLAVFAVPNVEAQLFDGKLPKIFNRGQEEPGRVPINRDTPDIVFTRDFGIPTPNSTRVETVKGHQVAFYITAQTKTPGMRVEFLVRQFPTAGQIVSIVSNQENRSSAIVTYVADPNSGATVDAFTFAARYPGGKYSTVANCTIEIKDAQALIEISPVAIFGKVMVGQSAEREIMITNHGNAPFVGTLNLPPPWKMISPVGGKLQLGSGKQTRAKIGYFPTFGGASNYSLILNRGDRGTCKLSGEAFVPFSIAGEEWELKYNPETKRREGEVIVTSDSPKPFEVFLRSSARLKTKSSEYTVIIPGRENRIGVYLDEGDVMAFDGGLEIKMKKGFKEVTSVFANTQESKLGVEIPNQIGHDVINFGKVTAGRSAERGILLKNIGGELMPIDVSVSEPFKILTNTDRQLTPMDSMPVSIGFYPHKSDRGAADQILTLRTSREELKIRLVGNALRPPGAPRNMPVPSAVKRKPEVNRAPQPNKPTVVQPEPVQMSAAPSIGSPVSTSKPVPSPDRLKATSANRSTSFTDPDGDYALSPFGMVTRGLVERERAPGLESAIDFEILKFGKKTLEFTWTAPKGSEIHKFELEMRGQRENPITLMPESVWVPYEDVEYERVGRLVKAKVKRLTPYTFYEFRVFTIDQNQRSSPPSAAFGTRTDRTMDWTYIYASMAAVLLGFIGWGCVKIVKDRRGEVYQSQYI